MLEMRKDIGSFVYGKNGVSEVSSMRASKQDLPVAFEQGGASIRNIEWGGMNVALETAVAGMDPSPMFKGLPDDRCQCTHWGYMIKGQMRVIYATREEIIKAGDVYYLAPGHIACCDADTATVEFSPKEPYQQTMEVAMRNFQALQHG